ncbi:MAG: fumarylacetoacetate hydrolase family protein [Idiomarina sp.]
MYEHTWQNGDKVALPATKAICVGRNYQAHAAELNNPVPEQPVLFIKPDTSLRALANNIHRPTQRGSCHYEVELAVLIGQSSSGPISGDPMALVAGYGLALDLTLRDLQKQLQQAGKPWERAKAFAGSCLLPSWIPAAEISDSLQLSLQINGELRQQATTADMIFALPQLLEEASQAFDLRAGDVLLTGTPAGVGALADNDELQLSLVDIAQNKSWQWHTRVAK